MPISIPVRGSCTFGGIGTGMTGGGAGGSAATAIGMMAAESSLLSRLVSGVTVLTVRC